MASLEFGLPELKAFCVDKLTNEITADTVCTTLINLRSCLGSVPDENSLVEEVQRGCFEFIESNTRAVFKSKGFLQLSKENVLAIIQSSKVHIHCGGWFSFTRCDIRIITFDYSCQGFIWAKNWGGTGEEEPDRARVQER